MIRLAKLIGVCMTEGGRAGDVIRRLIAPRLHWVPGLRARLLDGETPVLQRSTLVHRPRVRRSLAGRLCPNALLADGSRLDDAATGGFLLVTTVAASKEQCVQLAARGVRVVEAVPGSQLHRWLSAGHAEAALVRPDHTVMRAGRDLTVLCSAAPRFLAA